MSRWQYTLDQRELKCRSCLCLLGQKAKCLNDRCQEYGGNLEKPNEQETRRPGAVAR